MIASYPSHKSNSSSKPSKQHKLHTLHKLLANTTIAATLFASVLVLPSCSLFRVYQIELPQGTPISQQQAKQVQIGMSQSQVLYLLGSPALRDTLAPKRWDYIYDYQTGTQGKREGKQDINNASQHLIIYFDDNGQVSRIQGINSLPNTPSL